MSNTPRQEFDAPTKRAAYKRANGRCEGMVDRPSPPPLRSMIIERCNAPIDTGNFHYDHIDPDWFSKDNQLENCQVLCRLCHTLKTGRDKKNIAKAKRIIDKKAKARKPKGRPMAGTKRSGIRKRMSGKVEKW